MRDDVLMPTPSTATTEYGLYDYKTGELIGPATPAQVAAAGRVGLILIDADGDVIDEGSWDAAQPGIRIVYTS